MIVRDQVKLQKIQVNLLYDTSYFESSSIRKIFNQLLLYWHKVGFIRWEIMHNRVLALDTPLKYLQIEIGR